MDELREGCTQWLAKHKPSVLTNDFEAMCNAAGINVIWNAANFPEGSPIEWVWANCKNYARIKYNGKRNIEQLATDIREGMYTSMYANEGAGEFRGSHYVRERKDGPCESAEKLVNHVLFGENEGVQKVIAADKDLTRCMDRGGRLLVNAAQWAEELAAAAVNRKTLHSLLEKRIQLELAEKVGAEEAEKRALGLLEELDEEERDEDESDSDEE